MPKLLRARPPSNQNRDDRHALHQGDCILSLIAAQALKRMRQPSAKPAVQVCGELYGPAQG